MHFMSNMTSSKYVFLTTVVLIGAILVQQTLFSKHDKNEVKNKFRKLFTHEELSKYNGIYENKLYLAVIGSIFDVTKGRKHYEKGSAYNYFIGKDGTRGLITGNFKDDTNDKDHIIDLSCKDLLGIVHWRQTFKEKYIYIGSLIGRYFDENGEETAYMKELKLRLKECRKEKENAKKQEQLYPPCNIAWNEEDGTKLWCTKSSGGVVRNWEGVPRQLFTPGEENPICVCVHPERIDNTMLKEYEGCPNTSNHCSVLS